MSALNLTLEELALSKIYVNPKSDAFNYKHPTDYASPFLDLIKANRFDFSIRADGKIENQNQDDNSVNTSYSTVVFSAKIPNADIHLNDTVFNHITPEIGFVLSLEGSNPEIKCYNGRRVTICDNGVIFGADNIKTVKLIQGYRDIYEKLKQYVDTYEASNRMYFDTIQDMNHRIYTEDSGDINRKVGEIIRYCIANPRLGINVGSGMIKNIHDGRTNYRILDGKISAWTLYNACTEEIKKANDSLSMPLSTHIELLKININQNDLNQYLESIGFDYNNLNETKLSEIYGKEKEIIEKLKKNWTYENVEKSFYATANDFLKDINNYK